VDFCATNNAKIPIIGVAFGVCRVKNRLIGDFWGFTREAQQIPRIGKLKAIGEGSVGKKEGRKT
jgi:hypothetical protein